jgi:hypothetical protein
MDRFISVEREDLIVGWMVEALDSTLKKKSITHIQKNLSNLNL